MNRSEFDSLVRTLKLDELALATGDTIFPGTLIAPGTGGGARAGAASAVPPTRPGTLDGPGTLPRLELARPGAPGSAGAGLELVSVLGRGGMGVVWSAKERALDRVVAVKRLGEPPFSAGETAALLSEARATGALEHPAIVPVHGLGIDADGSPLMVMKRVEGVTLGALLDEAEHPAWSALERRHGDRLAAVLEILMRIADALELAHGRGFVHRDVKPDNVMVGTLGEVYLLDWGVALRLRDAANGGAGGIVGTPAYMAPEMVRGDAAAIDARTDVYLLGATLHHALTRRPRHEGTTLPQVLFAALVSEPPVFDANHDVPEELASLVRRATAAEPSERPASAGAFRDALAEFLRHRAAAALADRAIASLAEVSLPALGDAPSIEALGSAASGRVLTEVRFGLVQSLRDWPDNPRAKAALERALRLMIEVEIARRSPGSARALLAELAAPDTALEARIAGLETSLKEGEALARSALAEAADRDPTRGGRARLWLAGIVGVATAVVVAAAAASRAEPGAAMGFGTAVVIDVVFTTTVALGLFFARRQALVNRWSRQATALVLVAMTASGASHAIAWLRGDDVVAQGDAPTLLVFAVAFAAGAIGLTPRLWLASGVALANALAAAAYPAWSLVGSATTVGLGWAVLVWEGRARRGAEGATPPRP